LPTFDESLSGMRRWTRLVLARRQSQLWIAVAIAFCIAGGARLRTSHLGAGLRTTGATHLFLHVCLFGALTALLVFPEESGRWRWIYFACVSLLGFGTEFHEHLKANIPIEFDDVIADMLGAAVALSLSNAWLEFTGHRLRARAAHRRSIRRLLREGLHFAPKRDSLPNGGNDVYV
jgi:hypothetical protein